MTKKIGVLSYQGSVAEHLFALRRISDVEGFPVKDAEGLARADGMILPGGESTTISKLLRHFGLFDPLAERIRAGMPVWGTCAGLILLAKEIVGEPPHLGVMDIVVRRNAYGRQIDSFSTEAVIPAFAQREIPLVFIRAPWIESAGKDVSVLARHDGRIVAARQGNMLATTFHPELTEDGVVHAYFAAMVSGT